MYMHGQDPTNTFSVIARLLLYPKRHLSGVRSGLLENSVSKYVSIVTHTSETIEERF